MISYLPGEVETDPGVSRLVNMIYQFVQLLNFHEQVTGLGLCVVLHVVRKNLLQQDKSNEDLTRSDAISPQTSTMARSLSS